MEGLALTVPPPSASFAFTAGPPTLIESSRTLPLSATRLGGRLVGMDALTLLTVSVLPGLEPLDRLAGDPVVAALRQVPVARFGAERPLGVGDAVALPVLLHPRDGLPPGALPLDRGGRLAKLPQP